MIMVVLTVFSSAKTGSVVRFDEIICQFKRMI